MKTEIKEYSCLFTISYILVSFFVFNNVYAQELTNALELDIRAEKNAYFPGEPILLTFYISNLGSEEEKIFFGADGIEAFSFKIYDPNMNVVCVGEKIKREGLGRRGSFPIPPEETIEKSIVLNQWCSTLLSPGIYHIVCNIDYILFSELQKQAGTRVLKAGPLHQTTLELDIRIIEMDEIKFIKILKALSACETQKEIQTRAEWSKAREVAREMLAFTESELAVPYQLYLLSVDQYTWRKRDIIKTLVQFETAQAARGLAQIYEEAPSHYIDVKNDMIKAIFQLRETGKPEILEATEDFAEKYKRR